jgi:acyl-CoA synthetase (AMP-forming)/AMP-acid ligase II
MTGPGDGFRYADAAATAERSPEWRLAHSFQGREWTHQLSPDASVLAAFARVAATQSDAPLITEMVSAAPGITVTYGEMLRAVARRALALEHMGVPRRSRVGLRPRNSISDLTDILAVLWQGSAAVLANPADAPSRVAARFSRLQVLDLACIHPDLARAEARITDSDLAAGLTAGPGACADELAIVVFTSGSTGLPRAVGQSHGNIVVNATAVARHHNLDGKLSLFTSLPVFHVNALEFVVFGAMISGSQVFLAESFDPFTYLPALVRSGAHIASTVPSLLQAVAAGARRARGCPEHLRYVVSAAAPLAAATARAVSESLGVPVVQGYGMSEAANFSCLMPVRMREAAYRRLVTHSEIPSVGAAIWGNEVTVLDESGRPFPLGEIGEVGIRGYNVMLGYLDDDPATAAIFAGGWLHTGDLGRLIIDSELVGPMLQITGRSKHVVKVHGHTVGFEEVERALAGAAGISAVAATSVDHPVEGEVLCLLVVADDAAVNTAWVRAELGRRLGADYRPHAVHLVEALPLLHNGKIDRTAVRTFASGVR